jgi:serine protease Do
VDGVVSRGWLGVTIQDVNPDMAAALDLNTPTGAPVTFVPKDGPPDGILETGDVILEFNADAVTSNNGHPELVAAGFDDVTAPRRHRCAKVGLQ